MNGQTGFILEFQTTDKPPTSQSKSLAKRGPIPTPSSSVGKLKPANNTSAPSCTSVVIKFDFREDPVVVQAWEMEDLMEHAFAITVHKSQGNEFARVAVVLQGIEFENKNMLYTAITRAKSECVVVAEDFATLKSVATKNLQLDKRHSVFDRLLAKMISTKDQLNG